MGFLTTLLAIVFGAGGLLVGALVGLTRRVSGSPRGLVLPAAIGLAIGVVIGLLVIPFIKLTLGIFFILLILVMVAVIGTIGYYVYRSKHPKTQA